MKVSAFVIFFILSFSANAQKIEKYYNYLWKECEPNSARFYALIEKTDSGWHRRDFFIHEKKIQMDGTYEDADCQIEAGKFYFFHPNGMLESTGKYVHGKKDSLWLRYYQDGMMEDSVFYVNGNPSGVSMSWYQNGYPRDSSFFNIDGSGMELQWFDNGVPSAAGRYTAGRKENGKWQFFHASGKLSALETYDAGKLIDKQYFDEQGNMMADTSNNDRDAEFPGGQKAWIKFMYKGLYFPPQYKIANADSAVVVISFSINLDGKLKDPFVSTPFYPEFDKIALRAIAKSPQWIPAMKHNRKIYYYMRQPITFGQPGQ